MLTTGAMRVIITARQALTPVHEGVLNRLVNILGEISRNPSNPKFNQYCFESVSGLIRFVCEGTPATLSTFEAAIFGPAQVILAQDVTGKCSIGTFRGRFSDNLRVHPLYLPDPCPALGAPLDARASRCIPAAY